MSLTTCALNPCRRRLGKLHTNIHLSPLLHTLGVSLSLQTADGKNPTLSPKVSADRGEWSLNYGMTHSAHSRPAERTQFCSLSAARATGALTMQ